MIFPAFHKINLPLDKSLFDELFHSVEFESTGKGRLGNHLVKADEQGIPLVRTTTQYNIPAILFSGVHTMLADLINNAILANNLPVPPQNFNNALIEVYSHEYIKMNYHSDQSLDLEENSYIGLFSSYERPDELKEQNLRKLLVKDKVTNDEFEIPLEHHSIVLFSVNTNKKYQHKIVLQSFQNSKSSVIDNKWLGVTFRQSKTYIKFQDNLPYFPNGAMIKLADKEQELEFYQLRGQENKLIDFTYPMLCYTLSRGDLLKPIIKR
jgi:hypothetical protein